MTVAAEPTFFRAPGAERARFGWLYKPARPAHTVGLVGVVIVPPFGFEAICAHRTLRHLAERAAEAGMVAVRFDLDGTGDSAGDDLDRGRVEAWLASISDACELARGAGADRLVLVGVRLGATLAALAAGRRADVAGLVAIAATPSGKALVREQRMLQASLGHPPPPAGFAPPAGEDPVDEVLGFAVTGETRVSLSQIDLTRAVQRPAPAVLIIDRDDQKPNDAWAKVLVELGAQVTQRQLPGYVDMMADPHKTTIPDAMLAATVELALACPPAKSPPPPPRALALDQRAELPGGLVDEIVSLDGHMLAIATRAASEPRPRRALVLLNSGAIHRVGPNRLHVELARRLAPHGTLVVRIDQSGVGDSRPRPGAPENLVYSDHAIADTAAAAAWARRAGAHDVAVAGLCSGAYHAYKAAAGGAPIDTIIPINPLTFHWVPGAPLDAQAYKVAQAANRYGSALRQSGAWKKLLRGDVDVARVAKVVAQRARGIAENRIKDVARRLRVPLANDLGTDLLALGRRGVAMRFVFAGGEPGISLLDDGGGSAIARLEQTGALSITTIDGPDHTFTPRWSHEALLDAITNAAAPSEPAPAARAAAHPPSLRRADSEPGSTR